MMAISSKSADPRLRYGSRDNFPAGGPLPDDSRVKYCSAECDEGGNALSQCDTPLSVCRDSTCQFAGPTPGTQGAACTGSDECLGACDTENAICVEPCDSNDDCSDDFECRSISGTKVCTVPGGGGGCQSGGAAQGTATFALLLLGLIALRRRAV